MKRNLFLKIVVYLGCATIFLSACSSSTSSTESCSLSTEETTSPYSNIKILLDAGHGGKDPGKVGINNALEKDINLDIVYKLEKKLSDEGFEVVLSRTNDHSLAKASSKHQKRDDMNNRISFIKDENPDYVISIHQNSFPKESVSGPQVFYYKDSDTSRDLAEYIQGSLNDSLKPSSPRSIKDNVAYYLLKKSPTPTVIVECGFLSNPYEADLLLDENYQDQIVDAISLGLCQYLGH